MKIEEAIQKRRTVSSYLRETFPEEWMNTAIKMAITAPNHKLTKPWKFIELGDKARSELLLLLMDSKEKKDGKPMTEAQKEVLQEKLLSPHKLLLIATKRSENPVIDQENYASTSCAIQNMMLYFASKKIGTKWGTGSVVGNQKIYEMCKLDIKEWRIDALFYVGVPAHEPPPRKELNPDDFLVKLP